MNFYCISIDDKPACVVHDGMSDVQIENAIQDEFLFFDLPTEDIIVERELDGSISKLRGDKLLNDYDVIPVTVHGIEKVVTYQHKDKFLFDFVNSNGIADVGHVAQGLGIEHERIDHWGGELPTSGTKTMPVWPKTHLAVTVFDKL